MKYVLVMWDDQGNHGIRIFPHIECARHGAARAKESGCDSVIYAVTPDECDGHEGNPVPQLEDSSEPS